MTKRILVIFLKPCFQILPQLDEIIVFLMKMLLKINSDSVPCFARDQTSSVNQNDEGGDVLWFP